MEVRLSVKKMLLLVGVLAYQNYQRNRSTMVIVCANLSFEKYREKILKTDEITNDLFEEEYRYQWKNRH